MTASFPFEDQKGRFLLVDVTTFTEKSLELLKSSLKSVLLLNYATDYSHPRIPYFGLAIWNGYFLNILWEYQKSFSVGVVEIVSGLQTVMNTFDDAVGGAAVSEIDVDKLCQSICSCDLGNPKCTKPYLEIISYNCVFLTDISNCCKSKTYFEQINCHEVGTVIDEPCGHLRWPLFAFTFSTMFREWLVDKSNEKYHLHLNIPNSGSIFCDLKETVLPVQHVSTSQVKFRKHTVRNVDALFRIHKQYFSQENVFGNSYRVVPSSCWKLDFEQLTQSAELFRNMCSSLLINDQILICQEIDSLGTPSFTSFLPSNNCAAALLCPIISSEMSLPLMKAENDHQVDTSGMIQLISDLPDIDFWNPLIHDPTFEPRCATMAKISK